MNSKIVEKINNWGNGYIPKACMVFDDLSNKVISSAIKVHKVLGPGFLESIYHTAMILQLKKDGMVVETQKSIQIYFDDQPIGIHRLDLIVNNEIILELKAINTFEAIHVAQLLSYLKAANLRTGLLLNFAKEKLDIKRVVN